MKLLRDKVNILKQITPYRFFNLILLRMSYFISKTTKRNTHFGLPFSMSIEPTTACNLGCPECPSGLKQFTRATGKIDLELHKKMLSDVKKSVFYINYYFQGEPFLHPQFLGLIEEAKKNKIYTATSTNAHFIDAQKAEEIVKSGLDRLIISIDGLSQKTYEAYRVHGKLSKVIEGSKHLVEAKRKLNSNTPHLIFQFLVVKANEHEAPNVFELGKSIGINEVRLKTAQFYNYKFGNPLMPENIEYARYKKNKSGEYVLKQKTGNKCWRMWSSSVITWNGKIVPCCFDKDAQHQIGDISNTSFLTIWKSKKYSTFRQSILTERNQIDICKNCSEGAKVWAN